MSWQLLVFSGSITTNFKMTEYLTNSVMDRDESQIKKFRNAKKQIIKLLDERRKLHLKMIQLDFPK